MELHAFKILTRAGHRFRREVKENREQAFDNYTSALAGNLGSLVASRIATLEGVSKILLSTHTMLGAPKIKEGRGIDPMKHLEDFLTESQDGVLFGKNSVVDENESDLNNLRNDVDADS